MSEDKEKPLSGADAEAQPTRPDPRSASYRKPADEAASADAEAEGKSEAHPS